MRDHGGDTGVMAIVVQHYKHPFIDRGKVYAQDGSIGLEQFSAKGEPHVAGEMVGIEGSGNAPLGLKGLTDLLDGQMSDRPNGMSRVRFSKLGQMIAGMQGSKRKQVGPGRLVHHDFIK